MSRSRRPIFSAMRHLAGVLALAILITPVGADAQSSTGKYPTSGDWSVMFTLFQPAETTNFGIFRMFGDRANVGLEVDFDRFKGEQIVRQGSSETNIQGTQWVVVVGPSLRWYGSRMGPVTPYLRTSFAVGWGDDEIHVNGTEARNDDQFVLDGTLGIGAEWYPLRWLGIGGHTGLRWTRIRTTSPPDGNGSSLEMTEDFQSTFRSGIVASFYFR